MIGSVAGSLDRDLLERYLAEGMSLPQIAELTGRTVGTVGYWVRRHGLTANGSARFRPGKGVDRARLEALVAEGVTLGQIAVELEVSISTVKYWVDKYGLPSPHEVRKEKRSEQLRAGETRGVWSCKHHGETEFFADGKGQWRCRRCRAEAVTRRRRRVKQILVAEAGGRCVVCGYDRSIGALHFHHLDPSTKRFPVSSQGHTVSIDLARDEAAKCVLLCANCHVEVEHGITALPPQQLKM